MQQIVDKRSELLAALDGGQSLPSYWYTDPSITEQEIHKIFGKTWQYIGPLQKLAKIGDYIVGSSRVDLQACKLEYSIVSPK